MLSVINFEEDFLVEINNHKPVVISFTASWCGPCKTLHPILEKLTNEFPDILFGDYNIDNGTSLANKFGVKSVPTLIFFKNGELKDRIIGASSETQLREKLEALLK